MSSSRVRREPKIKVDPLVRSEKKNKDCIDGPPMPRRVFIHSAEIEEDATVP